METAVSPYLANGSGSPRAYPARRPPEAATPQIRPSDDSFPGQGGDRVSLSPASRSTGTADGAPPPEQAPDPAGSGYSPTGELNLDQYLQLLSLKTRDREVRAHEQAHLAAAGQYAAGGPSFTYTVGDDGKRYAVGGEVPIDISSEATPEETIRKMERIRAAALAPAEPSSADRQIAAQAAMKASKARQEMVENRQQPLPMTTAEGGNEQSHPATGNIGGNRRYGLVPDGVLISVMIKTYQEMQDQR